MRLAPLTLALTAGLAVFTAGPLALAALPSRARAPLEPAPTSRSSYGESFTFIADLDDGTYVHLTLSLTTLGPGGLKGICRGTVVAPSGAVWKASTRVGKDEVRYTRPSAAAPERLAVARCAATAGEDGALSAEVKLDEGAVTLSYQGPPLRRPPHDAVAVVGDDLYRNEVLYHRTGVRARLALGGRPPAELSGAGYADHSRSTVAGKELARRWVRFRGLRGEGDLLLLGREARDGRFTPLWSCRGKEGAGGCREYASFAVEQGGPAEAPSFTVEVKGDTGALALRSTRLLLRDAPVEELGVLGKLVAPFVGSPVTYTLRATVTEPGAPPGEGILEVEIDGE